MRSSLAVLAAVLACTLSAAGPTSADPTTTPPPTTAPTTTSEVETPSATTVPPTTSPTTTVPPTDTVTPGTTPTTTTTPPVTLPKGSITAVVSKEQGYGVENVEITVKKCSGESVGGVDRARTGPGGVAKFSSLPLGCYRVSLGELPAAYYAAGAKSVDRTLTITDLTGDARFTLASGPDATRLPTTLVKKDRVSGAVLAGATYSVELCNPTDPHAGQYTVTTGTDGTAGLELLPTCYKAVELVAPGGYVLDATPVYFEVVDRGTVVTLLDTRVDQPPVTRDPGKRVPVVEIPSGPIERN